METRTAEAIGSDSEHIPLYSVRWAAVFAGLAVGLSISLLLMLIGMAAGLAVYGTGGRPGGSIISVAAALWNTVSMFIAALIGGYVAACASGLRRSVDGMLHGVVSWGATMLCFLFLTGMLTGNALSGVFGMAANSPAAANIASGPAAAIGDLLGSLEQGEHNAVVIILRDRFGLTEQQAGSTADRALAITGRSAKARVSDAADEMSNAARAATVASAWLSVVVLLSLVAGAGGGLLGARTTQRRASHGEYRIVRNDISPHGGIPSAG